MATKFNPFRPDKLSPPGLFAGRIEEIKYIESCLRQTSFGNPKHFMLIGERGIGKSSLILFHQFCAQGKINIDPKEKPLNFLVLNISLRRDDTFLALIGRISSALKRECDRRHDAFGNLVLSTLAVLSRFEAAGVKYNHAPKATEEEAFSALQNDFEAAILKAGDGFDGILLLMDEADAPASEAGVGLFCKLLTEEMAKRGTDKVCIGLAGLPSLTAKLSESHESSLRLFHMINLKPLEIDERAMVVEMGLETANQKNSEKTEIEADAMAALSTYSEGYPHFLQEFAYCAFEADTDGLIDKDDFFRSLFQENGAFDQLGLKYFDKAYNTPSSDDYRQVLHAMSDELDQWSSRAEIIERSGLKPGTVDNALRALKNKNIIVPDELRPGFYRLPTRSFAAWINIRKRAEQN